jgi:hypothetical protein
MLEIARTPKPMFDATAYMTLETVTLAGSSSALFSSSPWYHDMVYKTNIALGEVDSKSKEVGSIAPVILLASLQGSLPTTGFDTSNPSISFRTNFEMISHCPLSSQVVHEATLSLWASFNLHAGKSRVNGLTHPPCASMPLLKRCTSLIGRSYHFWSCKLDSSRRHPRSAKGRFMITCLVTSNERVLSWLITTVRAWLECVA